MLNLLRTKVDFEQTVPVTLSIKNIPDDVIQRLCEPAARNHRSPQGQLRAIIRADRDGGHSSDKAR